MCNVDLPSGRLSQIEPDFSIFGPIPLALVRHYRSTNAYAGDLGHGWGHSFGMQLWRDDELSCTFRGSDGRRIIIPLPELAKTKLNVAENVALEHVPQEALPWPQLRSELTAGALVVHQGESPSLLFDARPQQRKHSWRGFANRAGILLLVETDAKGLPGRIVDHYGRILLLTRDSQGRLTEVHLTDTSSSDREMLVRFKFDANNDLVAAEDAAGVRSYEYDLKHRLVRHTDRCGGSCTATFDADGRCLSTSGPEGVTARKYEYLPDKKTTVVTNSLGKSSQFVYQDPQRVASIVDEAGNTSVFQYDEQGRMFRVLDPQQGETVFAFHPNGSLAGKVGPTGAATGVEEDSLGQITRLIMPAGAEQKFERDNLGRVVNMELAASGSVKIAYGADGGIAAVQTPHGKKIEIKRSPDGRHVVEADEQGKLTEQLLDRHGRLLVSRDAIGAETRFEYDAAGRCIAEIHPDKTVRRYQFDPESRLIKLQDESGTTVAYEYDLAGRRIGIMLPTGQMIRCEYDTESHLLGIRMVDGLWHRFQYDDRGLLAKQFFTDGRSETYSSDGRGMPIRLAGPADNWINAERDPAGHVTRLTYSAGSEKKIILDEEGRWVRINSSGTVQERELTPAGQPIVEKQGDFTLNREFGKAGELLTATDSFGHRVGYTYDDEGQVVMMQVWEGHWRDEAWKENGTPRIHSFEYDRVGNQTVWKMPGGKMERRKFDPRGRIVEQTVSLGDRLIVQRKYTYDATSRVRVLDDSRTGRREFTYGSLGELQSVKYSAGPLAEFRYDARGDLVQNGWLYDPGHRVRKTPQAEYEYDGRGFVIRRRSGQGLDELSYNDQGLLSSVRGPRGQVEYQYDAHARLMSRSAAAGNTQFYWDRDYVWAYRARNTNLWHLLRMQNSFTPLEQARGNESYTVHSDHLGRVMELIDEQGNVVWSDTSGVWGEGRKESGGVECIFGSAGQIWDADAQLYYNRYRYYEPETAHYITPDPIGIWGGLDAYRYVADPVNFRDPLGLKCRGKADDPYLYRGDSRPPSEICSQGFQQSNPNAGLTVAQHVEGVPDNPANPGSNWISTTHDADTAAGFGGGNVYLIDNPGCGVEVDCDPDLIAKFGDDDPDSEHEIAFDHAIPPHRILGYYSPGAAATDPWTYTACPP
jgi:RHS repeat-associated protein